jgi:hypothetical protein
LVVSPFCTIADAKRVLRMPPGNCVRPDTAPMLLTCQNYREGASDTGAGVFQKISAESKMNSLERIRFFPPSVINPT